MSVGDRLQNGNLVGVGDMIVLFPLRSQKERRNFEEMSSYHFGGHTSVIVGLFLSQERAAQCATASSTMLFDARWEKETKEVIEAISLDHPVFEVAQRLRKKFAALA